MRRRTVLWILLGLTGLVMALGVVRWHDARQAAARRIADQSRPSLAGPSQSIAPDFELASLDGRKVSLKDLRGKVVLLNFWATWCPPCKAEMPDLEALYREYGAARDFVVVGANLEEDAGAVEAFVRERGLSFPVLLDSEGATAGSFGVRGLPATFIIDREGRIRDAWNGQIAREAMLARLQKVW
jgi:peroxiredoxin